MATITTTLKFYEGSQQFDSVTSDLQVGGSFVYCILENQYNRRPTEETLWCVHFENGEELCRYELDREKKDVIRTIFWKMAITDKQFITKQSLVIAESKTHFRILFNKETGQTSDIEKTLLASEKDKVPNQYFPPSVFQFNFQEPKI